MTDAEARIARLTAQITGLMSGWNLAPVVEAIQAMRGVAFIVAVTVVAEVGDFGRFDNPRQLMAYLGLTPAEHSSGASVRRGGITKAGSGLARRALIEGAWSYRMQARVSPKLQVVNDALASLDGVLAALYTDFGRPSIAPERLIRASQMQILFSVRSERQLMEQMEYNLLFRWFVGLGIDEPAWVPTVFSKNRDRLLTTEMSRKLMAAILAHSEIAPLLSDDHFSVDGTLVKAWASMKSFQPKTESTPPDDDPGGPPEPSAATEDHSEPTATEITPMPSPHRQSRNAEVDFRGEKRSNATHASTTDPDARLYKKSPGTGAMLCFIGHALMENRSGLIVQGDLTRADGRAERRAAIDMIDRHSPGSTRRLTVGADKGFDTADFVAEMRRACVTSHVAEKARHSAIDGRTTRHEGYALSIKHRKRIEEAFGWAKTVGGMAQTVYRGIERVRSRFVLTMAANNLARLPRLLVA